MESYDQYYFIDIVFIDINNTRFLVLLDQIFYFDICSTFDDVKQLLMKAQLSKRNMYLAALVVSSISI